MSLINNICFSYAVSKQWHKTFEKHLGYIEKKFPGQTVSPGPVSMNIYDNSMNIHIQGHQWRRLIRWYGISEEHELDRKYNKTANNDFRTFDLCVLSPLVGKIKNKSKSLNLQEFVGYIECQMRKIFHVPEYLETRLWMCEKNSNPQFELINDRAEELQFAYGIEENLEYIIAIEICQKDGEWPTGLKDKTKGTLRYFDHVTKGCVPPDKWKKEISAVVQNVKNCAVDNLTSLEECIIEMSKAITKRKENKLSELEKEVKNLYENNKSVKEKLKEKSSKLNEQDAYIKERKCKLETTLAKFTKEKGAFLDEKERMKNINKIQENVVKLNIGGTIFVTSQVTLRRDSDSMLAAMFSGRHKLTQDTNGAYFIDRDGTHFRYILNYLRNGTVSNGTLPTDNKLFLNELLNEAEFYQITGLITYLEKLLGIYRFNYTSEEHESELFGTLFTTEW